jgi:hypothetical protein
MGRDRRIIKQWKKDQELFSNILLNYLGVLVWIIEQIGGVAQECEVVLNTPIE